jgi:predicted nucleotidyltransferase
MNRVSTKELVQTPFCKMIQKKLQSRLVSILLPYGPRRIGIFGSYARGENRDDSDLDILISFNRKIGLLKLVQIQQELSDKLGKDVDLVTENSLKNPRLKKYIYRDLITIFNEEEQAAVS